MINLRNFKVLPLVALVAVSACSSSQDAATRLQATPLTLGSEQSEIALIEAQAASLNSMSNQLVKQSTVRGAKLGAAVGCGLALVSAKNAQKCLTGAIVGGGTGAAAGYVSGKRMVAQRVSRVPTGDLYNTLNETTRKMTEIKGSLPKILAAQDAELAMLKRQRAANALSPEDYAVRVGHIRDARTKLAQALTNSAENAHLSADKLGKASVKGQPELLWHIGAAKRLEQDAISTRSQIKLF